MTEQWIVIPNWDKFQHRDAWRSRVPTWICDYLEQDGRDDYRDLTLAERGLLACLRREYASSRGRMSANTLSLSRRIGAQVLSKQLERLNHAGFIEIVASKPAGIPASKVASEHASLEGLLRKPNSARPPAHARGGGGRAYMKNGPPAAPCPECGVGGERHAADCSAAPPPGAPSIADAVAARLLANIPDDEGLF